MKIDGSVCPFPEDDELSRFSDARLHLDCLARWEHRIRFSRGYYDLARDEAPTGRTLQRLLLAEGDNWVFMTSTIGRRDVRREPTSLTIQLADWPVQLYFLAAMWPAPLTRRLRSKRVGDVWEVADEAMNQIIQLAPDMAALREMYRQAIERRAVAPFSPPTRAGIVRRYRKTRSYLPPFTPEEQAVLDDLTARHHARGKRLSFEILLASWLLFAEDVDDTKSLAEEFAEYLYRRDAVEQLLGECSAPLVEKLRSLVAAADEKYRAATVDDAGRALSRWWSVEAGSDWWWQRRPTTGPLSDLLDSRRDRT
ncbi:hypothetical protein FJV41_35755 [Myxococcus llanfairpwllgwyngyllgogerychwyrndrobwllllantysiliogogogochensis]|uniref:Uncharacterized protein n=1 Tax=Myxococcus llanfairpwllgwyngyllgogerychwyrndrobwllllantysiliogogogochensis TaxID=2590453 RepID=A0A540WQ66_9BACT|nr:hypothetical protein [Myxococcus llanfairpwllgwyngyllgogerychwyrndrobwllllantysiliogogogochensis]TQF11150.1 hypothetical protein FJV41_35755 [Myxococcus llanfairpwllgwyngyllgogerychwyrndrobwllllantysiliogogogochensis]